MKLLHGDCLELMKDIPDNSIDMVLTSPPYDDLRSYNGTLSWNFDIFKKISKHLARVIKSGGVIVWIVNDKTSKGSETGTSFRQALYFKELDLNLHDTMIYQKPDFKPLTHKRYEQSFEYMFIFAKDKLGTFNGIKDKKNVGFGRKVTGTWRKEDGGMVAMSGANKKTISEYGLRSNIWSIKTAKGKKEHNHPAVFPYQLAFDHVLSWSNSGDVILDPFLGSSTTGIACKNLNRKFIGIEMDDKYFEIAKNRIENNAQ